MRRLGAGRQALARLAEALVHLLAREVDVDVVVEDRRHLREAVARERARVLAARGCPASAVSIGNVTCFSTSTGESDGATRVDLHLVVGDVGHGVDRQPRERARRRRGRERASSSTTTPAVVDREAEDAFEHGSRLPSVLVLAPRLAELGLEDERARRRRRARRPSRPAAPGSGLADRSADLDRVLAEHAAARLDGHEHRRAALDRRAPLRRARPGRGRPRRATTRSRPG